MSDDIDQISGWNRWTSIREDALSRRTMKREEYEEAIRIFESLRPKQKRSTIPQRPKKPTPVPLAELVRELHQGDREQIMELITL